MAHATTAAALSEAKARLARLDKLSASALSHFGSILHGAKIQESSLSTDADAAVEGAQLRGASLAMVTSIEALLELVQEVKLDAALSLASSDPPSAGK